MVISDRPLEEIVAFLANRHGEPVHDVEPLAGGFWSAAYGYRVGDRALVARFGPHGDGFEADRAAMAHARPGLPVPAVFEVGQAFGAHYALSVRATGRFLEDLSLGEAAVAAPAVERLLAALRSVDDPSPFERAPDAWRASLLAGLVDDPTKLVSGWRATLAADPRLDQLFTACAERIDSLLDACPERRDLVHRDLLHQNVLVADDLSHVTAVFSWKCAGWGDFLYDTAWCTFWGAQHPGIDALDLWTRTLAAPDLDGADLVDASARHHCYEVQIGAHHLGWYAWTGEEDELRRLAEHLAEVVERGPRS